MHLEQIHSKTQYRQGSEQLGYSSAAKDMGILTECKLSVSQQYGLTARKTNHVLGCTSRSRDVFFCPTWHLFGHTWMLCPVLLFPVQEILWKIGAGLAEGHQSWWFYEGRKVQGVVCIQPGEEKGQRGYSRSLSIPKQSHGCTGQKAKSTSYAEESFFQLQEKNVSPHQKN